MELFARELGAKGPVMVIVHGLYGESDNWLSVARQFENDYRIILPDQRNHGQSPHNKSHSYEAMANDLLELIRSKTNEKVILVGHSMGGKTVMRLALENPEIVSKLVVLDIAPKDYGTFSNFAQTTTNHLKILDSLIQIPIDKMSNRGEMDRALANDLPSKKLRQFLLKNVKRNKEGGYSWQLNLPVLKEEMPEIMDGFSNIQPINSNGSFPVFLIRGEQSPYVADEDTLVFNRFFPGTQMVTIPDAGHWLHADQPELFIKTLRYLIED
ncbi:alpha/beta fold hydrolase [Alkalitalea saponilacus]|uniref:Pimeloyl-ACP methyl ester carboxylesterase n=1 Tax=Alkalitalea saponilacus TaxID=889453 RepID=A0A1T5HT51_9BACT|nr:alpha/beta fold hydrolase [Alkalitalea saponilacus]ASB48512.1 alpha/beta hydrolase [Alkalitalea saponilacus]SKC23864.1 Pimeloyl-ACP methyl ester carboxylesterase [Alkalitalea saponilacus]